MKRYLWPVAALLVAVGFQGNLPVWLSVWGGGPDLVLVVLIAFALGGDAVFGATLGFIAGLLHGTAVGFSVGSFVVTRTLAGLLSGLVNARLFRDNPVVPTISAVWLTAVSEFVFLIANPRVPLLHGIRMLVGECVLNAALTLGLCFVMRAFETKRKIKLADARF